MTTTKLTILFTPLNGWGHINACQGLAQELQQRGHRVVFAIDKAFKDALTPFGFEEQIHVSSNNDQEYWPQFMKTYCSFLTDEPIVIAKTFYLSGIEYIFEDNKNRDKQIEEIVDRVKPNVIITDNYISSPILIGSDIPWVWLFSAAPQAAFNDDRIPPALSGLPLNGNREEWRQFSTSYSEIFKDIQAKISEYGENKRCPKLENGRLHPISPHLNIYLYPKELDYEELQPMADNWIRVENFIRITNKTFEVPKQLTERPGKLVYLSMGTFGCANIKLMIRLVNILAKSEHKFIVSKGPAFESHKLPDNMWGQRFLPQIAVIPKVDLVITHGGNNTVTETFYHGKPMLVLPLFGDQLDNAQRVSETGLGLRLNPFHCTESELLSAVDRLVSDKALAERMTAIGHRIRNTNDKKRVSVLIEKIFE